MSSAALAFYFKVAENVLHATRMRMCTVITTAFHLRSAFASTRPHFARPGISTRYAGRRRPNGAGEQYDILDRLSTDVSGSIARSSGG